MTIFKHTILFLIALVCTTNVVHAKPPSISEKDFIDNKSVMVISHNNNKYLAILANNKIIFEELKYRKQKRLTLKSKKILLKYLRKSKKVNDNFSLSGFKPLKYWERDKKAYLISIINIKGIKKQNTIKKKIKKSIVDDKNKDKIKITTINNQKKQEEIIIKNTAEDKLSKDELTFNDGKPRFFGEVIFFWENKNFYLSTEWTSGKDSRLDLDNFKIVIEK